MTDGRDPADRVARGAAHDVRVGPADGLAAQLAEASLVGLVGSRHEHQDGLVPREEDERLDDLTHRHAAGGRGLGRRAGALGKHDHLAVHAERLERALDPRRRRRDHLRSSGRNRRTGPERGVDGHR